MEWKARGRTRSPYLNPGPPWLKLITTWCWASHCTVCLINLYLISINSGVVVSIVMKYNLIVRKLHGSFVSVTVYCLSLETIKFSRTENAFCLYSHYSLFFLLYLSPYILLLLFLHCSFILLWLSFFPRSFHPSNFLSSLPPFFPCLSLCFLYSSSLSFAVTLNFHDTQQVITVTNLYCTARRWPIPLWGVAAMVPSVTKSLQLRKQISGTSELFCIKSHIPSCATGHEMKMRDITSWATCVTECDGTVRPSTRVPYLPTANRAVRTPWQVL